MTTAALRRLALPVVFGILAAAVILLILLVGRQRKATRPSEATYVGGQACATCHRTEYELWRGSDHDLAMQVADASTVLGDFEDASFTYAGVTTRFFKRDGNFFVRTDGPDGNLTDYRVLYSFGARPLQQYLLELPRGRLQALSIAWDARPREKGGQRWFHLYPNEKITHDDVLHWTGIAQNWNHMCAECHSTDVHKNFSAERDRFESRWSDINVSCEACHGPGSEHVASARALARGARGRPSGLVVDLKDRDGATWVVNMNTGLAKRSVPRVSRVEVETCARCHSRRSLLSEDYVHGKPLMDTHRPALLEEGLYYDDGQIKDEVYEYGSFLQSKMYREGVTCKDCHDPHGLRVRGGVANVCVACHLAEKFDSPAHHFHESGAPGSLCVDCHMPVRTYMVVDPRRDHSFRVPRPDLSVKMGTPNACTLCHADRSATWASETIVRWYGSRQRDFHFAETLHAARAEIPGAAKALVNLIGDPSAPAIARATALTLFGDAPDAMALERAVADSDPLLRVSAASVSDIVEPARRTALLSPLLHDTVRAVRLEAARALASAPPSMLSPEQKSSLEAALGEYRAVQLLNADRHESHLNLGLLHLHKGEVEQAEASYRRALAINPWFVGAYVNLADLYRARNRDDDGEKVLLEGISRVSSSADLHHALGLLRVRQKRVAEGVKELGQAVALEPENARYAFVYGVGLYSEGKTDEALSVLRRVHEKHPGDRDALVALATVCRDAGRLSSAVDYATKLVLLSPQDAAARQLLDELRGAGTGR